MNRTRLEALADALMRLHVYHDPTSESYKLHNPGMLKSFSPMHEKDENGYRIFKSLAAGYDSLLKDLEIKCSGRSHAKLNPETDTLYNLVACFGMPRTSASNLKKFLRRALQDENVMEATPLGWFLQDREIPQTGNTMETA